jgi:2-polyprenyl-6-methoxyphenol hydroxylase-like FAD-dependent oxidoreductase
MYAPTPSLSTWSVFWVKIFRRGAFPSPPARQGLEALRYLKETTQGLVEPFQSQIDWAREDDSTMCFINEMKTWTPTALGFDTHGGRVTLAGDSAHSMLPYRGQGFQHAVVDADLFVEALKKGEGIEAYNAEMVERGAKAVAQSLQEAELSMDLEGVRRMMMARQGHGKSA